MRHMTLKVIVGFDDSITYYLLIWDTCFKMNFLFCLSMTRLLTHWPSHWPCCTGPRRGSKSPRFGGTPFFVAFFTIVTSTSCRTSRRWRSHETHLILKRRCSCLLPSQPGQFPGPDIVRFLFYTFCLHCISNLAYWMMPLESSQWITSIGIKSVCRFRLLRFKRYYES